MGTICKGTAKVRLFFESASGSAKKSPKKYWQTPDKCAKVMGLPYPGGPHIDRLAAEGDPEAFRFARPRIPGLDYSFSGLKTSFLYTLRDNLRTDYEHAEKWKFGYLVVGFLADEVRQHVAVEMVHIIRNRIVLRRYFGGSDCRRTVVEQCHSQPERARRIRRRGTRACLARAPAEHSARGVEGYSETVHVAVAENKIDLGSNPHMPAEGVLEGESGKSFITEAKEHSGGYVTEAKG